MFIAWEGIWKVFNITSGEIDKTEIDIKTISWKTQVLQITETIDKLIKQLIRSQNKFLASRRTNFDQKHCKDSILKKNEFFFFKSKIYHLLLDLVANLKQFYASQSLSRGVMLF